MDSHNNKEWIQDAQHELYQIQQLIQELFAQLASQYPTSPHQIATIFQSIIQSNSKLEQYRTMIEDYVQYQMTRMNLYTSIQHNQSRISSKLLQLQLLDEEIITELQTWPYSTPNNVKDEFSPMITNPALTVQSISLPSDSKLSSTTSTTSTTTTTSTTPTPIQSPTASLDVVLYLSRQLQCYRESPNIPIDFRRSNAQYHPDLFRTGLLIKSTQELSNSLHTYM